MNGKLTVKKTTGSTGRESYPIINDQSTEYYAAQSFVSKLGSYAEQPSWFWTLLHNPIAWRLWREIGSAARTRIQGTYFRARNFKIDNLTPGSSEFGPPPLCKQREGRYTLSQKVVHYLSRHAETAAIETENDPEKPRKFIQKFELEIAAETAIYLNQDLGRNYPTLQNLLVASEYPRDGNEFVRHPYRATQLLSYICQMRGVLAIEYPSIKHRFAENPNAVNIALFGKAIEQALTMTVGEPFEFRKNSL